VVKLSDMAETSRAEHMLGATQHERCSTASKFSMVMAALGIKPVEYNRCSSLLGTAGSTEQADMIMVSSSKDKVTLTASSSARPMVPGLKKAFSLSGFQSSKRGSKDDCADRDSTQPPLSNTSQNNSTAGWPMVVPAFHRQHTLWQALKTSGRRLLPSCCLPSGCGVDKAIRVPLNLQQQQETSCASCRHCAPTEQQQDVWQEACGSDSDSCG
jgi:hypothetical protein